MHFLKNIFRANSEFRGWVIFGSEMTHLPWTTFFWYRPLLLPSSTYWHFSVCKIFTKIFTATPEPWGHINFESKMVSLPQAGFFWKKIWTLFLYTYWPLLLWKIFKKFLQRIQSYKDASFFGPWMAYLQQWKFFSENLSITLVPFIRACLNAKYQVRWWSIKEILMIKEYWNLIGQETFSTITWGQDFCQAFSLHRMLMNHKNSRFTAIPDKTHDTIFLKSPKTVFLGHFGPFLVIFARRQFVSKNLLQFHPLIYGSLTPC